MATFTICDMCKKPLSEKTGYKVTSQSKNPKRKFVLSPKDLVNPNFSFELCDSCAKKVHEFIRPVG